MCMNIDDIPGVFREFCCFALFFVLHLFPHNHRAMSYLTSLQIFCVLRRVNCSPHCSILLDINGKTCKFTVPLSFFTITVISADAKRGPSFQDHHHVDARSLIQNCRTNETFKASGMQPLPTRHSIVACFPLLFQIRNDRWPVKWKGHEICWGKVLFCVTGFHISTFS